MATGKRDHTEEFFDQNTPKRRCTFVYFQPPTPTFRPRMKDAVTPIDRRILSATAVRGGDVDTCLLCLEKKKKLGAFDVFSIDRYSPQTVKTNTLLICYDCSDRCAKDEEPEIYCQNEDEGVEDCSPMPKIGDKYRYTHFTREYLETRFFCWYLCPDSGTMKGLPVVPLSEMSPKSAGYVVAGTLNGHMERLVALFADAAIHYYIEKGCKKIRDARGASTQLFR